MNRKLRHITLMALLLLAGNVVMAQNDGAFVINKVINDVPHYLAHVKVNDTWVLQDANEFNPDNCLWYSGRDFNVSGTNHNYYFLDETGTPRYLAAPLQADGTIYLSGTTPPATYLLSNPDMDYYFYDWDRDQYYGYGVARGHQYAGITSQSECEHEWDDEAGECWEVYWVGYSDGWKMSSTPSYDLPEEFAARYHTVTITQHPLEVSSGATGGLTGLSGVPASMTWPSSPASISGDIPSNYNHTYTPAYGEYAFEGGTHYFYNDHEQNNAPGSQAVSQSVSSYLWTITGPGAEFLSLSSTTSASPELTYSTENITGHKTATVTLTVTYPSGATQSHSATVQVLMQCGNPAQAAAPVVSDLGVTVSWVASADEYRVQWKKHNESDYGTPVEVGTATSYTITGLDYDIEYDYQVIGYCGTDWLEDPSSATGTFKTKKEPNLVVYGAIFGGGRMADVTGKTEVVIINADSIGAIYGGNDIAGEVKHADGATITLGVNSGDAYASSYGTTPSNGKIRVGSVYGGGNGYYKYDGNLPSPAVGTTVLTGGTFSTSVTELSGGDSYLPSGTIPKIIKTTITMSNDAVKVDSLFGGAKNAFLSASSGNSTTITVNGGIAFAVFGGNNFGGVSGTGTSQHAIEVNGTKAENTVANYNANETGRDFGVRYLFGGGNKVAALGSDILISGGQCDTVFAGGNSADVTSAQVVVNCSVDSGSGVTFGNTYSNAIASATSSSVTVKDNTDYAWNGTGIYNVRTLFGGNNRAHMTGLPTVTLTSGSVGTVYGGGNAGDMLAQTPDGGGTGINGPIATDFGPQMEFNGSVYEPLPIWYGTHVVMNQATMLVDYLYGGCQMSDVEYSTWVEIQGGHVGTVYGGCNISGDVGSEFRLEYDDCDTKDKYQETKGATYVKASGGTIHGNLFAGSNGFYHCNNGIEYISGLNFGTPAYDPDERYVGDTIPTHNETHVMVSGTATIEGNVYAGGNMAYVGFIPSTDQRWRFRDFVGLASVRMTGGTVEGDVYGGGNRASVFGSNEVKVSGGTIGGALYGGNDRAGQVAQISNRVFYGEYGIASDGYTNLKTLGVNTYVSVTGHPHINTVYGGGNGAYTYTSDEYCDVTDQPVQSNTFVDINIDGYPNSTAGGYIATVYGGGNGVTVTGGITVLLNIKGDPDNGNAISEYDHVGNIFGGNNQGPLAILPDIILMEGQANTVYGGCNAGAMTGSHDISSSYTNVGSWVHLRPTYTPVGTTHTFNLHGTVSHAVYGGCRMNGVNNNSVVLVDGGTYAASLFGGSDISGEVSGTSQVVVKGGTVGNVYGGGNGNYDYTSGDYAGMTAPTCATSQVDILGGQVGDSGENNARNVFGGGLGHDTQTTGDVTVNIGSATGNPTIYGDIYGGSALGKVNSSSNDVTTVNVLNGNLYGDVYGGGLGHYEKGVDSIAAVSYGKTYVNIGADNNGTYTGNVTFHDGRVFGCNNEYGSPLDSVFVNIYKTAHGVDAAHNLYPTAPSGGWSVSELSTNAETQTYAINAVYGGGNLAAYTPTEANRGSVVHVYGCDNTVRSVFGGGNAADVGTGDVSTLSVTTRANTNVIVEGGRFHRVIGGGNGEVAALPAANIFGTANTTVYAGLIDEIYGGANIKGSVDDINLLISNPDNLAYNGCTNYADEVYGMVFGCANAAPYNKSVTTTIECGVGEIGALYGGSNQNYIGNPDIHNSGVSVTLNLYGGEYVDVFAGSKGVAADPANNITGVAANIYGDVNLNLYGGKITNAFGGCDANGNVTGVITVNVLDQEGDCALDVTNIYGASNLTAYTPDNPSTTVSPVVNVIHIKNEQSGTVYGIRGDVFGGGNLAEVTSNPKVNIGYHSGMTLPVASFSVEDTVAKVTGNVFGGGNLAGVNGNDTVIIRRANSYANKLFGGGNEAGVTGNPVVIVEDGTVNTGVYGGCNTNGTVTGDIEVNIWGGTLGTSSTAMMPSGIFGGGYGAATQTNGNVTVNIGDATHEPVVYADVYGGSALGDVHTQTTDVTTVNFAKGTLNGNLYGGGLGQALPAISAEVNGNVVVNIGKDKTGATIDGGHIYGSVFGANNINGSPKGSVTVNVYSAVTDSIFGGGNQSAYAPTDADSAYPEVNVSGGEVKYKVVGGGNAAGVTANPHINISGGQVCTDNSTYKAGVYGGCNASGDVNGDVTINITGTATIGTMADLEAYKPVSVHGGGYGQPTEVKGSITVNYGEDDGTVAHSDTPKLYGDLYGGSALGSVNTNDENTSSTPTTATTVNVLNGSFGYYSPSVTEQYGGNIYGGGLGDATNHIPAKSWGVVHVNIGAPRPDEYSDPLGKAALQHCNVYGCNNAYGSPQQKVFVNVYQTHHTTYDMADYTQANATAHPEEYAIQYVFGGGNKADYDPYDNSGNTKRVYDSIHYCENTIQYVYGGGNAADVTGTMVVVDGGRHQFIFGGGNGQVSAANVGSGGVDMILRGGRVGWYFGGCNMHGSVSGGDSNIHISGCDSDCPCSQTLVVDNYYFGANMATIYDGLTGPEQKIDCGSGFEYVNVYAGSRLATVYGDITLTVNGGSITNLFGGNQGSEFISADVKKYPADWRTNQDAYDPQLIQYLQDYLTNHGEDLGGTGGNITITIRGGRIENVFGGCDYQGLVEGNITIIVDSSYQDHTECGLDLDYVYGGSRYSWYAPDGSIVGGTLQPTLDPNRISPIIDLRNGHVNYDVFGGSLGGNPSHQFGNGIVVSNPRITVGSTEAGKKFRVGRDLFGGGSAGKVIGETNVILQGKATIGGNVFGGGKQADVEGNTNVTIVPNNP